MLSKESGVMSAAINVGFAAIVWIRSRDDISVAITYPGALRKKRIARDLTVVRSFF